MSNNKLHSKAELDQITNMLIYTLKTIYNKKGRNFNFRIRYLTKITGVSPHTITNLRRRLPIEPVHTSGRRGFVYKTIFDGKSGGKK